MNFPEGKILVAGDTLNDKSLYDTQYKGVVVGSSEPALLDYTATICPTCYRLTAQGRVVYSKA